MSIIGISLSILLIIGGASSQKCELSHSSIGDINLTERTYEAYKEKNPVFLLGLSDSDCETCCWIESMLQSIHSKLKTKNLFNRKPVPLARIDMKEARHYITQKDLYDEIDIPKLLLYKRGRFYHYDSWQHYPLVLNFINRVLFPTLELKRKEEVNSFMDVNSEYVEKTPFYGTKGYKSVGNHMLPTNPSRVLLLISEKTEYKDDIKKLRQTADKLSIKGSFRVGLVTNSQLVKELKKEHSEWFGKYSSNTLVLLQKTRVQYVDIETMEDDYYYWIIRKSLKLVNEVNRETSKIYRELSMPVFMIFDHFENHTKHTEVTVQLLERVASEYRQYLGFDYEDISRETERLKNIGLANNKPPIVAIFLLDGRIIPFPKIPFTQNNLQAFLMDYRFNRLEAVDTLYYKPEAKLDYMEMLRNTHVIHNLEYYNQTVKEEKDVLVLFYYSNIADPKLYEQVEEYDKFGKLFKDSKVRTVKICSYDLYYNFSEKPKNILINPDEELFVHFFPAFRKTKKRILKYTDAMKMEPLMKYLEKNADIEFKMPKLQGDSKKKIDL